MNGYGSRKFLITGVVILLTAGLALAGKMDQAVALVFAAAIASYNWANAKRKDNGNG